MDEKKCLYSKQHKKRMGPKGFEPSTARLSVECSTRLSYGPGLYLINPNLFIKLASSLNKIYCSVNGPFNRVFTKTLKNHKNHNSIMSEYLRIGLDPTSEVEGWPALDGAIKALDYDTNFELIVPIYKDYISEVSARYNDPRIKFEAINKKSRVSALRFLTEIALEKNLEAIITATDTRAVAVCAEKLDMYTDEFEKPAIIIPIPSIKKTRKTVFSFNPFKKFSKEIDFYIEGTSYLLDGGENTSCKPEDLLDFAILGTTYLKQVLGIKEPTVGLVNIGDQAGKGRVLEKEAYKLLDSYFNKNETDATANIRSTTLGMQKIFQGSITVEQEKLERLFLGNAEPWPMFDLFADIYVTDGFIGNYTLKIGEALVKKTFQFIKKGIYQPPTLVEAVKRRLGAFLMKNLFYELKAKFDPAAYGGAPLLGVDICVIKCHGNSDDTAFYNAIKKSVDFQRKGVIEKSKKEFELARVH